MGDIIKSAMVTNNSGTEFFMDVKKCIDTFQGEGLSVEVQYQVSTPYHSALILGRVKEAC